MTEDGDHNENNMPFKWLHSVI